MRGMARVARVSKHARHQHPLVARLVRERRARQLTQPQLAELIGPGVTRFMLGRWETGERQPSPGQLDRWATALGLELVLEYRRGNPPHPDLR